MGKSEPMANLVYRYGEQVIAARVAARAPRIRIAPVEMNRIELDV